MRNSIILPEKYEDILMIEANKCGLLKFDTGFDPQLIPKDTRCFKTREKIFQMILLYDEIIIPTSRLGYQYDDLKNVGNFLIYPIEDYALCDPTYNKEHLWYAKYLKQAILPVALKQLRKVYSDQINRVMSKPIASNLYDLSLELPTDEKSKNVLNSMPEILNEPWLFAGEFIHIKHLYKKLCWLLDISLKNESYILNSEFSLSKIGCDIYTKDITTQLKAYELIKFECSRIIGNLPHMGSLNDVLVLKEKRKTDIKNLREVLYNLETVIKEQGTEKAVIKATYDVQKAAKSLAKGNQLAKVGKWLTLISVPVTIAEILYNLPPVSSLLSICGAGACLSEQFYKNKGGWCEVVR